VAIRWGAGAGAGYEFEDECPPDGPTFNQVGRLAMANAGPGTTGSQFFVTVGETPRLNGKHTIFGQVADGYAVVEEISQMPTAGADKPVDDVMIERIEIED
jgi:peptidyl-prolyl cis-trans isomerase A (cyclophilin A)